MDYYNMWLCRYILTDKETREASRKYWIEKHKENLKSERPDLIMFSQKMLATWVLADELTQEIEKKFI